MKKIITIIELISMIKNAREELDSMYKYYINPGCDCRSMVSIYNKTSNLTINGIDITQVNNEIKSIDAEIKNSLSKLQKLLLIKEQVNAMSKISITDQNGILITISIAQALVLKSDSIKKYNIEYLDKLEKDYESANKALSFQQSNVMDHDKIDHYVYAKMQSLNVKDKEASYTEYAKEYINANKMELLDPLNIGVIISEKKSKMKDFYSRLDLTLLEFNAKTKIWINLDDEEKFWGFVD